MKKYPPDTFFNGHIVVRQESAGYRFSIDAVLLADYTTAHPDETLVDLGTGCGILPLILAYRYPKTQFVGIEIQSSLAELAVRNVHENSMSDRIRIMCRDMKSIQKSQIPGPVDRVISNPPYRKPDTGRVNPNPQRAVARHEIKITLEEVVMTAARLLRPGGRFTTIYPAGRLADLMSGMQANGIEPEKIRTIHSRSGDDAKLVLTEGIKGGRGGVTIEPPLIIYQAGNTYTDAVEKMFSP
jgi:tRNA1Val (adenine37-N6)-methyltransferase